MKKKITRPEFMGMLQNPDCSRIDFEAKKEPSEEFKKVCSEFGFNTKVLESGSNFYNVQLSRIA
jgi:hypothetical protein